jgi:hypothetical protein
MFEVGKILFVISKKTNKIFPVQIIECVIRKTTTGESYSHTVVIPYKDRAEMRLEEMDVDIFPTLDSARDHMMHNAISAINEMVRRAGEVATSVFSAQEEEEDLDQQVTPGVIDDDGGVTKIVDLGNGQKARLRI